MRWLLVLFIPVVAFAADPIYPGDVVIGNSANNPQVVFVGDSLTLGYGGSHPIDYFVNLHDWSSQPCAKVNIGVSGIKIQDIKAQASVLNAHYNYNSALNIAVIWAGTNDFYYTSDSPQKVYSYLREFCQHQRRFGWRVFVVTMASRTGLDAKKEQYNQLIRGSWDKFADGLIDIAQNTHIGGNGAYNNQTYFNGDGIHLTDTSYTLIGQMIADTLNNYLDSDIPALNNNSDGLYPPLQNATYVKATSTYSNDAEAFYATDPEKSLTGHWIGNGWFSGYGATTHQRLHIDLGTAKTVNKVKLENHHYYGYETSRGVKNFTLWGSNDASAFNDLNYNDNAGWTQLTTDITYWQPHSYVDDSDPQYAYVTNTQAYRYYAIKFEDNWGAADFMCIRRIELQQENQ